MYTLEEFTLTKTVVSKSWWQRGTGCFGVCELEGDEKIQALSFPVDQLARCAGLMLAKGKELDP